jgi:hypothetical protein
MMPDGETAVHFIYKFLWVSVANNLGAVLSDRHRLATRGGLKGSEGLPFNVSSSSTTINNWGVPSGSIPQVRT